QPPTPTLEPVARRHVTARSGPSPWPCVRPNLTTGPMRRGPNVGRRCVSPRTIAVVPTGHEEDVRMGEFGSPAVADGHELLVDRAVRLFRCLAQAQQLRSRPVNAAADYARGGGMVLWLDGLRDRPAVTVAGQGRTPAPEETVLTIDRIPPSRPPEPDDTLRPWLAGRFDDPDHPPALRESLAPSGEDDLYEQDVVFGGSATYDDRPYGERPPY